MMGKVRIYLTEYQDFKDAEITYRSSESPVDKTELLEKFFTVAGMKNVKVFCQDKNSGYALRQSKALVKDGKFNRELVRVDERKEAVYGIEGMVGTLNRIVEYGKEKYDVTLEIRSRFDEKDKPYFLGTMLESVLQNDVKFESIENNIAKGELDLFGFLSVTLFCSMLKGAHESGIYKTYVRREHNDSKLRGSLDIPRHIRLNVGRNDTVAAYTTRELTHDNELNHLIMHTWKFLREQYPGAADALFYSSGRDNEFYDIITELKSMTAMTDMRLDRCTAKCQRPITGPFYAAYEKLRQLCLKIISYNMKANIFGGDYENENVGGILFYSPDLWEAYLEKRMRDTWEDMLKKDYKLQAQDERKVYSRLAGYCCGNAVFTAIQDIRPDYVIYKKDPDTEKPVPITVLDAKFKKLHFEQKEIKIEADDLNKLLRDMIFFGVHYGGLIFPYKAKNSGEVAAVANMECQLSMYDKKQTVCVYCVPVPVAKGSYTEWKQAFDSSSETTLAKLRNDLVSL